MNEPTLTSVHDTIPGANGPQGPEETAAAAPLPVEVLLQEDPDATLESSSIASNWVHARLVGVAPATREELTRDLIRVLDGVRRMERMRLGRALLLSAEEREENAPTALDVLARTQEMGGTLHGRAPTRSSWRYLDVEVLEEMRADGRLEGSLAQAIRTFYKATDDAEVAVSPDSLQLAVWVGAPDVERPSAFH